MPEQVQDPGRQWAPPATAASKPAARSGDSAAAGPKGAGGPGAPPPNAQATPGSPGAGGDGGGGQAPVFAPAPPAGWLAGLREITSTAIAAAVVGVAMLMLCWTFLVASGLQEKKDIMLYGLTILGPVIGFYFGRVPAERRAEAAEANRNVAQESARWAAETASAAQRLAQEEARLKQVATAKVTQMKGTVERVKGMLGPAVVQQRRTLAGVSGGGAALPADRSLEAYLELEALSRQL